MAKLSPRYTLVEKTITGSTNTDAMELASTGAPDFTLVWAHEQTSGRGRGGRSWISEPGNLFWSVILRNGRISISPESIVFVAAMAIAGAIKPTLPDQRSIAIKWPNDALIKGAKFSGTLAEANPREGWVVVGIGINLKTSPSAAQTIYPATCLADAGSTITSLDELCERLSAEFEKYYDLWVQDGLDGKFREQYHEIMWKLGEPLEVSRNLEKTDIVTGVNRGIDERGHLLLETERGEIQRINVGDVLFRL